MRFEYKGQPLGISIERCHISGERTQVIVDQRPYEELRYWGGGDRGWVGSIFQAELYPYEGVAASSTAYRLWRNYSVGEYAIEPGLYGLYPCYIWKLQGIDGVKYYRNRDEDGWTENWQEARPYFGEDEFREPFFKLVMESEHGMGLAE